MCTFKLRLHDGAINSGVLQIKDLEYCGNV